MVLEMENYNKFAEIIEEYGLTGEQVLEFLTNWNGTQIVDGGFIDYLRNVEGYEEAEQ